MKLKVNMVIGTVIRIFQIRSKYFTYLLLYDEKIKDLIKNNSNLNKERITNHSQWLL